jgi:Putative peptidoglycan binding domain
MDLCLGSCGGHIRALEQKLRALNLYSGPIDGIFGGGVESGVKRFQSTYSLPCDGIVGSETWNALFPNVPQPESELLQRPLAERCLALTGAFETSAGFPDCFTGLAGDFDGEGISFGVLQWNIGQGTLQPLFEQMLRDHPQTMTQIFQDNLAHFASSLSLPHDEQLAWWSSLQSPDKAEIFEPWKGYLLTLGRTSSYQQIQMDHSAQIYTNALALAQEFDLHSERSVALMFDILVQNGGIDSAMKIWINADFTTMPPSDIDLNGEIVKMQAIANRVAESSRPEYIEDVRTRKLVIANGAGSVHGRDYELSSQYGIALVSAT